MRMSDPKVTVLLAVHNGAFYLRECLDSIVQQTFVDFEFLIIDDGSTDRTPQILAQYQDSRICLITNSVNLGLTRSLNNGLHAARGDYIARIDADDRAAEERLAKQAAFLNLHPQTVLLATDTCEIDSRGTMTGTRCLPRGAAQLAWHLMWYNCLRHCSVMFRRQEVLALGGYAETLSCAQDYELWLRIADAHAIASLPEPLAYYRAPRDGSITQDKAEEQTRLAARIQMDHIRSCTPGLAGRQAAVQELKGFLFGIGAVRDLAAAETVLRMVFDGFCEAAIGARFDREALRAVKVRPCMQFAWACHERDDEAGFIRFVVEAMASGATEPFDIPGEDLRVREERLMKALRIYGDAADGAGGRRSANSTFMPRQYCNLGWQYYGRGDMISFRRCLARALEMRFALRPLLVLLTSLLGRRVLTALCRLRGSAPV